MRFSDVTGERVFDVIAAVIDPLARIIEDESVKQSFKGKGTPAERLRKVVPVVIQNHKNDVCEILAAIEGCTVEEYVNGLTLSKLLGDVFGLLTDEEFLGFLPSMTVAGSSSENTTA